MQIKITTKVNMGVAKVAHGFDVELFKKLNPPWAPAVVLQFDGCKTGDWVKLKLGFSWLGLKWYSRIAQHQVDLPHKWSFVDVGVRLPFFLKTWEHSHLVENANGTTHITDLINYQTPWFVPAKILHPFLVAIFKYRKPVYQKTFGKPAI